MRLKIRTKLVLTFLGALVIAAVALAAGIAAVILTISGGVGELNAFQVGKLSTKQRQLVEEALASGADAAAVRQAAVPADLPTGVRIRLVDKAGKVWVDTEGNEGRIATGPELVQWLDTISDPQSGMVTMPERVTVNGEPWGFYGVTFASHYGLNINLNDDSPQSRLAVAIFLGGMALALIVNIALFWVFGLHMVKPLRRLSGVVSQIAAGDLSARASLTKRGDELGQLAADLDLMAARLEEARDTAQAADEARRYLVAAVSHDLRTPLTALLGHAEAIRTGVTDDPQQSLAVIEEKGLLLKSLINDLFELAAMDAAPARWQTVRTDLAELVRQSVVGILPELEAAGIEVEAEIPDGPVYANLAPGKLERVMDNLLANGRKYGASGHWLGIKVERVGEQIRVEVANRGEPIPPEVAAQIFKRFYRADGARTSGIGGAGLGLAIAREIIVRHGGEIGVESQATGGAVFWFTVPGV